MGNINMKNILLVLLGLTLFLTAAKKNDAIHYGKVLEVTPVMGYDYLKVDENGKTRWIAIATAPVKVGDKIGYDTQTIMKNFQSKSLNKTFDEIIFANEVYLPEKVKSLKSMLASQSPESKVSQKKKYEKKKDFKEKDFYTVADLFVYRANLEGKKVKVKAKVRKVSHQIMKRDWVHLEDGTGTESEHNNDIVFTATSTSVKVGDTVIARGTIVIDKDFGYGYFYPVLGEKAQFE